MTVRVCKRQASFGKNSRILYTTLSVGSQAEAEEVPEFSGVFIVPTTVLYGSGVVAGFPEQPERGTGTQGRRFFGCIVEQTPGSQIRPLVAG